MNEWPVAFEYMYAARVASDDAAKSRNVFIEDRGSKQL
jgi:hypothetical protein